jgi:hypothetical protein
VVLARTKAWLREAPMVLSLLVAGALVVAWCETVTRGEH